MFVCFVNRFTVGINGDFVAGSYIFGVENKFYVSPMKLDKSLWFDGPWIGVWFLITHDSFNGDKVWRFNDEFIYPLPRSPSG